MVIDMFGGRFVLNMPLTEKESSTEEESKVFEKVRKERYEKMLMCTP